MISKEDIFWVNDVIRKYDPYRSNIEALLPLFPKKPGCPRDLRRWICALASNEAELNNILYEVREVFGNRSIVELLKDKEFEEIRTFLLRIFEVGICGPGSQ